MTPLSPSTLHETAMGLAFGITDTGTVRPTNQDNFLIDPVIGLVAVADGMGGHAGGDIASTEALRLLAARLREVEKHHHDPDTTWTGASGRAIQELNDAVLFANEGLYRANCAAGLDNGLGMGTTLSGLWQPEAGGPAYVFHVGDSRIYRLRHGLMAQLTHDQTLYQQALELGATSNLPPRNLLLQALGPGPDLRPDVFLHPLAPGDVYMLCSDGLHGATSDADIRSVLDQVDDVSLAACCISLVEMAKRDGSRDNITVLLLRCPD